MRARPASEEERLLLNEIDSQKRRVAAVDPDTGRRWQTLSAAMERADLRPAPRRTRPRFRLALAGVAFAGVAAAILVAGIMLTREPVPVSYRTARGEQSTVLLADSSQVTLNHTSELTLAPAAGGRTLALKGEAFFRVRKTGEEFVVRTEFGTIRVLGTEFNVRVRDDELEVAVLGGKVRVSVQQALGDSSVILLPGQFSRSVRGGPPCGPEPLLFSDYPGWLHGKLLFQSAAVPSVCREIESKFDVTVGIANPRLRNETLTGSIDARTPEAALATIARLTGSSYRHEANGYILF